MVSQWRQTPDQVLTIGDSTEEAERLGRSITGARLAACVQIAGPASNQLAALD